MTKTTTILLAVLLLLSACSLGEEVGSSIDEPLPDEPRLDEPDLEQPAPARFVDLEVKTVDTYGRVGEPFTFSTRLTSRGTETNFQVLLTHTLKQKGNDSVILTKDETVALEIIASKRTEIIIPKGLGPGRYVIETKGTYESGSADSSFEFDVEPAFKPSASTPTPGTTTVVIDPYAPISAPAPADAPGPAETVVEVNITGLGYEPQELTIKPGTWVKWNNKDSNSHTATGAGFDAVLRKGESYLYRFNETRIYSYTDTYSGINPGTIYVEE